MNGLAGQAKHRLRIGMTTVVAPFGDSKPLSMCFRLQRAQATQHSVRFDLDSSSFRSAGGKNRAAWRSLSGCSIENNEPQRLST